MSALFKLYVIDPPKPLCWNTPRSLLMTAFRNSLFFDYAPIGHVFVELIANTPNPYGVSHFVTGMSRVSKKDSKKVVIKNQLGFGSFFHDFAGTLDPSDEARVEIEKARKKNRLKVLTAQINDERAQALMKFIEQWISSGAFRHYGGGHNPKKGDGAGCAEFAMICLAIAQGCPSTHESWVREVHVAREFVGVIEERRVSFTKILLHGAQWAEPGQESYFYRTTDPELISKWASAQFPNQTEIELQRPDVNTAGALDVAIQFEAKYPIETAETVQAVWNKIEV